MALGVSGCEKALLNHPFATNPATVVTTAANKIPARADGLDDLVFRWFEAAVRNGRFLGTTQGYDAARGISGVLLLA